MYKIGWHLGNARPIEESDWRVIQAVPPASVTFLSGEAIGDSDIHRILEVSPQCHIFMRPFFPPSDQERDFRSYLEGVKTLIVPGNWQMIPEGQRHLQIFNEMNMPHTASPGHPTDQWEGFGPSVEAMERFNRWFCIAYDELKAVNLTWKIGFPPLTPGNQDAYFRSDPENVPYYMHGPEAAKENPTPDEIRAAIKSGPCRDALERADECLIHVYVINDAEHQMREVWAGLRFVQYAKFFPKPMDIWITELIIGGAAGNWVRWFELLDDYPEVKGTCIWRLGYEIRSAGEPLVRTLRQYVDSLPPIPTAGVRIQNDLIQVQPAVPVDDVMSAATGLGSSDSGPLTGLASVGPAPRDSITMPPWIFGMHDPGDWRDIFQEAGKTGWVMFNQIVDPKVAATGNPEFATWAQEEFGVLARLVHAPFHGKGQGDGSIPLPEEYDNFAQHCADFVRNSPGCRIWFVGNEMNIEWHWPNRRGGRSGKGGGPEPITPELYAACFGRVYQAIKKVQPDAWVIPSGLNPLQRPNAKHDDALDWFRAMLEQITELDGLDIHAYFALADGKNEKVYTFAQFLELVPSKWRELPVFITESTPPVPWLDESDGWMQRTFAQVNRWNCNPDRQPIYTVLPYRWGREDVTYSWNLAGKRSYHVDLGETLQYDYRWRVEPGERFASPIDREEALKCIKLVESQLAGEPGILKRITSRASQLLDVPADALVFPTDTSMNLGFWERQRLMDRSLDTAVTGGDGFLDRLRRGFRSQRDVSDLLEEIRALAPVSLGQAAVTDAANLPARHIIHAPIRDPRKTSSEAGQDLATGLEAALTLADRLGDVQRIVLPAIDVPDLDVGTAAEITLSTVLDYLQKGSRLQEVVFVPDDEESYQVYSDTYQAMSGEPQFWLVTARPEEYDWDRAFETGRVSWTNVKGSEAKKNIREETRPGDFILAYRSTPDRYITGLGHIVKGPYPYADRHAVDIEMDLKFDGGVTLDELRQAVPDLQHVTRRRPISFSPVTPAQWAVIRELILHHNPDLAPNDLPLVKSLVVAAPPQPVSELVEGAAPPYLSEELPEEDVRAAIKEGDLDQALSVAMAMTEGEYKGYALASVARALTKAGEHDRALTQVLPNALASFEQALAVAREKGDQRAAVNLLIAIGTVYNSLSDYDRTLDAYQQALTISRKIDDQQGQTIILNNIAAVYDRPSNREQVLDAYQQALIIARETGDRQLEATLLSSIGFVYRDLSSYKQALDYYQQRLALARKTGDPGREAMALSEIGLVYRDMSDHLRALDAFQQALSLRRKAGDQEREATVHEHVGRVHRNRSDYVRALAAYQQALSLRQKSDDRKREARAHVHIGAVYSRLPDYEQALDHYRQALAIRHELGDQQGEVWALSSLGALYGERSDRQQALEYYQQALALARKTGDRELEATLHERIASVYHDLPDHEQSLDHYRHALDAYGQVLAIAQKTRDREREASLLSSIGWIYRDMPNREEQALDVYRQALSIRQEMGDRREKVRALANLGDLCSDRSEHQQALEYYQQALAIAQEIGDRGWEASLLSSVGSIYRDMPNREEQAHVYRQALSVRQEMGDRRGEVRALADLGALYWDRSEHQQALEYYPQALAIAQEIGDREWEASLLYSIGSIYRDVSSHEQASDYYQRGLAIFEELGLKKDIERLRREIAGLALAAGEFGRALEIAQAIEDVQVKADTLEEVVQALTQAEDGESVEGVAEQAIATAEAIKDETTRGIVLGRLALALAGMGAFGLAWAALRNVDIDKYLAAGEVATLTNVLHRLSQMTAEQEGDEAGRLAQWSADALAKLQPLPPEHRIEIEAVQFPDELVAVQPVQVTVRLLNAGNITWRKGEPLHLACHWWPKERSGESPVVIWNWTPDLPEDVPPGSTVELGDLEEQSLPDPGSYEAHLTASGLEWEESPELPTAIIPLVVTAPPQHGIAIKAVGWPELLTAGEPARVTVRLRNTGGIPWRRDELLSIICHWWLRDQVTESPVRTWSWSPKLAEDVPLEGTIELSDLEDTVPAEPGRYETHWSASGMDWGEQAETVEVVHHVEVSPVGQPGIYPPYIFGLHDRGGEHLMLEAGKPGWVLVSETLGADPDNYSGSDYTDLSGRDLGVIVRLNHGYGSAGTIPHSRQYDDFARRCGNFVEASRGCRVWIIGNEMNLSMERPGAPNGQAITPELYATCFEKCRDEIRRRPGHEDDQVVVGAMGLWNTETTYPGNERGDWVQYLADILELLGEEVDGIALHTYTHGSDPSLVFSADRMNPPFAKRHYHFRAYRDFMAAIPGRLRDRPVYITETNPGGAWQDADTGWVRNAYKEVYDWNKDPYHQPVQALILFRWPTGAPRQEGWAIEDKPGVQDDFLSAMDNEYRVVLPRPKPEYWMAWLKVAAPSKATVGETVTFPVTVRNEGTLTWSPGGDHPVNLACKWLDADGKEVDADGLRTPLNREVAPFEEITLDTRVELPLEPGQYVMQLDMIHEGVTWFQLKGSPPHEVQVEVEPAPLPVPDYEAEISLLDPQLPDAFWPGEPCSARLEIHNQGTQDWFTEGTGAVLLNYQIVAVAEGFAPIGQQWRLPKPAPPDGSVTMEALFTVPVSAGDYRLEWSLVREVSPSRYEPVEVVDPPALQFHVLSLEEGRQRLIELFSEWSPEERRREFERIGQVVQAGTDSQVRQMLLEEALFQGLFDADWTVGRTALYALYGAREQYDGLDNWLKAQFAGKETDLTLVRELAEKRLRRDEKEWLTSLLPPPPFTEPDYHANWGELDGPTSMDPGADVPLNVVVYNHGPATWAVKGPETVQLGYRWTDTEGTEMEGPRIPLPQPVAAGETLTLSQATVQAPEKPGFYNLELDMVKGEADWFSAQGSPVKWLRDIRVGHLYRAAWLEVDAPAEAEAGESAIFPVTVRNEGALTWTPSGDNSVNLTYKWLDADRREVVADGLRTSLSREVAPLEEITLDARVQFPAQPGAYILQIDMVHEMVTWFQQKGSSPYEVQVEVEPVPLDYAAEWLDYVGPQRLIVGQVGSAYVKVKNVGDRNWPRSGAEAVQLGWRWLDAVGAATRGSRTALPQSADAGETLTLPEVTIYAPGKPGSYTLELDLVEGTSGWFADRGSPSHKVQVQVEPEDVLAPDYLAEITLLEPRSPEAFWPGESYSARLGIHNQGTQDWSTEGVDAVLLSYRISASVEGIGPIEKQWRLPKSVPAGGSVTVEKAPFTVPLRAGNYKLEWGLVRGDSPSQYEAVEVVDPPSLAFRVYSLEEGRQRVAGLVAPSEWEPGERRRGFERIGQVVLTDTTPEKMRQVLVEEALLQGPFDVDWHVGRIALYALHDVRPWHKGLDGTLKARFADGETDQAPVDKLTKQYLRPEVRTWLEALLPTPPPRPAPVIYQVTLQGRARYIEPEPDHLVNITVGPEIVTLEYGDRKYKSLNLLEANTKALRTAIKPKEYGELLFDCILNDEPTDVGQRGKDTTWVGYNRAFDGDQGSRRIEIALDKDRFHNYEWEYLREPGEDGRYLALHERSPFYRPIGHPRRLPEPPPPLKVLVAICAPTTLGKAEHLKDLAEVNVGLERRIIETALKRLSADERPRDYILEYDILDGTEGKVATPMAIHSKLDEGGYNVLHLLCHGYQDEGGAYQLVMEDAKREDELVNPEWFAEFIAAGEKLRLVVLATCQSAFSDETGRALRGLGPLLVRQRIPAVIAMQERLPVKTAQLFAQHFYDDLARSGSVDMAMSATRLSLKVWERETGETAKWGIPVLLMGTEGGCFFQVDEERADKVSELEPDLKEYQELAGDTDLRPQMAHRAIKKVLRSVYGPERMPAISPAFLTEALEKPGQPFAARQDRKIREMLKRELAEKVSIDPRELKKYVESDEGDNLSFDDTVYTQVASALNMGKHVILIGPPGTGKTTLAEDICKYAKRRGSEGKSFTTDYILSTATADWTTFDTIGGYVPTARRTLEFRPGIFLKAVCYGHWLIIDEINRAEIDKAFGELFTLLSGQQVDLPYKVGPYDVRILPPAKKGTWEPPEVKTDYDYVMHPNWRIIGTMNVYDKSQLFYMSFAFMRRFAFVDVGLPDEDKIYKDLRHDWLDKRVQLRTGQEPPQEQIDLLKAKMDALFRPDSDLMKRRALGPAIALDMTKYIADRYQNPMGEIDPLSFLGEAFLLYAAPQLDGLDRQGITNIYQEIKDMFTIKDEAGQEKEVAEPILARIRSLYPHMTEKDWEEKSK